MRILSAFAALLLLACPAGAQDAGPIDPQRLSEVTRELASDRYFGRAPGGPGEQATVDYIAGQFEALGLEPAGDDGGFTQVVRLHRFKVKPGAEMAFRIGGETLPLRQREEIHVQTLRPVEKVALAPAPIVFVGYGVHAPERGWDDYKGVDLTGKVALFLINDPDFEAQAGDAVAGKFGGNAATYYARWSYKFEEAARRGAAAALIVHETAGAAYGWSTVIASDGEAYDVVRDDPARDKTLVQGWIQRDVAVDLFRRAGLDFEALKSRARTAEFQPVRMGDATFAAEYGLAVEPLESRNVLAKITGAERPMESVMYAAHWDGYGVGAPDAEGRTIRPGALDDAIGVAAMFEIARAFKAGPAPERTVTFAAWTAEERGLLGSEYYAADPALPHAQTVANFTLDVLQPLGASKDIVLIGAGQNELEDLLAEAAAEQGRVVTPDSQPQRALFYRADHFSLARRGVPVLLVMALGGGPDLVEGGRAAGDAWVSDFTARCYHQTCDAWSADWDLTGAAQDVALVYEVGRDLANSRDWPGWKPGSEFVDIRAETASSRQGEAP